MGADWERPILFEGVALPGTAIAIDHLGLYDNLPEMSEGTSEWLWQFTICVGRTRSDSSSRILLHVNETIELIEHFRNRLILSVPKQYDRTFTPAVIEDWQAALRTVATTASSRPICQWIAPLRPGDRQYGKTWTESLTDIRVGLEKAVTRANDKKGPG